MTTRHADTWKQHAQKYKTLIASYSPPLIRSSLWLLSSSYLESSKWNKNTKKSRSLHHKLFMYKICSASFFSLQDYLGRQHIIEAPSIKATKDVHISLKGGEKLLKLSIPVWWNSSEIAQGMDFTSFWKISRSYEKDWPKWWSLGVQKLRFISWKHRDDLTSDS